MEVSSACGQAAFHRAQEDTANFEPRGKVEEGRGIDYSESEREAAQASIHLLEL